MTPRLMAQRVRDKILMKQTLRDNGIRVPDFTRASKKTVSSFLLQYSKIVLKPQFGSGSKGLFIIESSEQANAALDRIGFDLSDYIVEEFISGTLFHIDSAVGSDSIAWAEVTQYLDLPQCFLWGGVNSGCRETREDVRQRLLSFNESVINLLGIQNRVTHHECFLTPDGRIVFCEIAGRPGGGGIAPYLKHCFGMDLYELLILLALRRPIPKAIRTQEYTHVGYLGIPPRSGKVIEVSKPEDFVLPWILAKEISAKNGAILAKPEYSGQTAGIFVVGANSEEEFKGRLEYLRKNFKLETTHETL